MSGVEIAGFVLAAIPLMISFLEHYHETAEVLEGWWQVKRQYTRCMRDLKYHKVAFEENLEELLLPLIADEETMKKLLSSPGGKEWDNPELEEMLKARMPKAYSSYLDTMEMMKETLEKLEECLGMNKVHFQSRVTEEYQIEKMPSGKRAIFAYMTSVGVASIEFHGQSIAWAFNKGVRQELFDEFGRHNARLRDILGSSDRLATLRSTRVSKAVGANAGLWKFWSHGETLFKLLTEAWSCRCQAYHQANLLLQHRVAPTPIFRVIFWFKTHTGESLPSPSPWKQQDTSIKLIKESQPPPTVSISVPVVAPQLLVTRPPLLSLAPEQAAPEVNKLQKPARRSFMNRLRQTKNSSSLAKTTPTKASFEAAPIPAHAASSPTVPTITSTPTPTPPTISPRLKVSFNPPPITTDDASNPQITNLCTTFATCSADLPYGCLKGEACSYIVQPLKTTLQTQEHITLSALLGRDSPIKLSRRQRFEVALILASTHIQLHPTPWLKSKWSKNDIFFPLNAQDAGKVCTDQPYISRSLSKALNGSISPAPNTNSGYTFQSSVRNLGIMLLELCFGTSIEEHRICRSMPAGTEEMIGLVNYMAATEWLRDVVEEAGPEYSDAVTWCLYYAPESGCADRKEEKWREAMYEKVVGPLKYCHDQLVGV